MKIKNLLFSFVIIFNINLAFADNNINNNNQRTVANFNSVNVAGNYTIVINGGQTQSLSVAADPKLIESVLTDVKDNELFIHMAPSFKPAKQMPAIQINLTVPNLKMLKISGQNTLTGQQIKSDNLLIQTNGKQTVALSGTVNNLNLELMGNNIFDGEKLVAQKTWLKAAGLAQIKVYADQEFRIQSSGKVSVKLFGKPKIVSSAMIGGGQLEVSN